MTERELMNLIRRKEILINGANEIIQLIRENREQVTELSVRIGISEEELCKALIQPLENTRNRNIVIAATGNIRIRTLKK